MVLTGLGLSDYCLTPRDEVSANSDSTLLFGMLRSLKSHLSAVSVGPSFYISNLLEIAKQLFTLGRI